MAPLLVALGLVIMAAGVAWRALGAARAANEIVGTLDTTECAAVAASCERATELLRGAVDDQSRR